MAIVRCYKHPVHISKAANNYVKRVEPVGYPNTAAICGIPSCNEPGLIWLTDEEYQAFDRGERHFKVKIYTIKIKASDKVLPLPQSNH